MKKAIPSTAIPTHALKSEALAGMTASFDRFCLAAGIEALSEMMEQDAEAICGSRHARGEGRQADRWGRRKGRIGFHGGKVDVERPRVRGLDGEERILASWKSAVGENWLGEWAMNPMLIAVSTRKFERSVRLPGGRRAGPAGRRSVEIGDLAPLRRAVCGAHEAMDGDPARPSRPHGHPDRRRPHGRRHAADGGDRRRRDGGKHPLGLVEGATENAATARALIANLIDRGLDPAVPRLFIIDGSKALSTAIRRTFGRDAPIQRRHVHKARNILERLPKSMHASVRSVLRQVWKLDDAAKAEKLLRNLARRLEADWDGVAGSILEGLDEMLTVTRLGLPRELRRSLACTNIIENVMGTVRRVCRNVKHWRSPSMAMRCTAAAMIEAKKGFRRLKAHKQLPALRAALDRKKAAAAAPPLAQIDEAA